MDKERSDICEFLKLELSEMALLFESKGIYAEVIDPTSGQYLFKKQKIQTPICESDARLGQLANFRYLIFTTEFPRIF